MATSENQQDASMQNMSEAEEVDAISTVALLIDDLSSEDPHAKQHSIQRLSQIAQLLGPERCVEELIPMLTELIDKIDCNPELMMNLAEQLGNLRENLGPADLTISGAKTQKSSNCAHLLRPLEMIAGSDDSVVQTKAIASLAKVSEELSDDLIMTQYCDLMRRLKKGDVFSMRIAACHLYADIYPRLNEEKRAVARKKFTKLASDDTPMVRWGLAQASAILATHLEKELISEFLMPIMKQLLQDKNDSVKVHALQSAVTVAKLLGDPQKIATDMLPSIKAANANKQSWRLRFAVAENASQIAKYVKKEQVDSLILPFYTQLMNDNEPEVRSEAVNRLAELAEYCTSSHIVQKVLPGLKLQLTTESNQHVKGSMAHSVCKLAEKLRPEEASMYLIPMVSILLKNNSTEVVVSLIENLAPLVSILDSTTVVDKIIPAIVTLANDKTWRIRYAVVKFLPKLAKYVNKETFTEKIEQTLLNKFTDPVFTIREETCTTLIELSEGTYDKEWLQGVIKQKMEEFSKHEKFMIRIHTVFIMGSMVDHVSDSLANDSFVNFVLPLAKDPVPNIRFNVSKLTMAIWPKLNASSRSTTEDMIRDVADTDTDFDAKYFAGKALEMMREGNA